MTYRRFLKEDEPSGKAVCQCCGAHLRRIRGPYLRLTLLALGMTALTGYLAVQVSRKAFPSWGAGAIILAGCVASTWVASRLGLRSAGWVATED